MKQIALSIRQMKHLQELGVNIRKASMYYAPIPNGDMALKVSQPNPRYKYPAFTMQDIFELLPLNIREYKLQSDLHGYISYTDYVASDDEEDGTNRYVVEQDILHAVCCKELLTSAYEILCWCAENGYLNKNEIIK